MRPNLDFLRPERLSLGNEVQQTAIQWNNSRKHPVIGFVGARVYAVACKPVARVVDVSLHVILGVGKLLVGLAITMPISFVAYVIRGKGIETNWTVKQGLFHFGYAALYFVDIFASPVVNLISPNIYPAKRIHDLQKQVLASSSSHAASDAALTAQVQNLQAQIQTLQNDHAVALNGAQRVLQERQVALDALNLSLRQRQAELDTANRSVQERQAALEAANEGLAQRQAELDAANVGLAQRQAELGAANAGLAQRQAELDAANAGLAQRQAELDAANVGLAQRQAELAAANEALLGAQGLLAASQQNEQALRQRIFIIQGENIADLDDVNRRLQATQNQLTEAQWQIADRDHRIQDLERRPAENPALLDEQARAAAAAETAARLQAQIELLTQQCDQAAANAENAAQQALDMQNRLDAAQRQVQDLQTGARGHQEQLDLKDREIANLTNVVEQLNQRRLNEAMAAAEELDDVRQELDQLRNGTLAQKERQIELLVAELELVRPRIQAEDALDNLMNMSLELSHIPVMPAPPPPPSPPPVVRAYSQQTPRLTRVRLSPDGEFVEAPRTLTPEMLGVQASRLKHALRQYIWRDRDHVEPSDPGFLIWACGRPGGMARPDDKTPMIELAKEALRQLDQLVKNIEMFKNRPETSVEEIKDRIKIEYRSVVKGDDEWEEHDTVVEQPLDLMGSVFDSFEVKKAQNTEELLHILTEECICKRAQLTNSLDYLTENIKALKNFKAESKAQLNVAENEDLRREREATERAAEEKRMEEARKTAIVDKAKRILWQSLGLVKQRALYNKIHREGMLNDYYPYTETFDQMWMNISDAQRQHLIPILQRELRGDLAVLGLLEADASA